MTLNENDYHLHLDYLTDKKTTPERVVFFLLGFVFLLSADYITRSLKKSRC